MNYYEVSLLKSPVGLLTYQSEQDIAIGTKVSVPLRGRKVSSDAVIINKAEIPDFKCKDLDEVYDLYYDQKMLEVSSFISQYYVCSIGEALSLYHPFKNTINYDSKVPEYQNNIELSSSQQEAYDFTVENNSSLIFGDTSSGKTEIYIQSMIRHIDQGKQIVLLMPEISLTPQMQTRLEKVFGKTIALWHSKITKKKRETILDGVLDGSIKIVAGARSALFLPFNSLGLIIVDEEHDSSYKSDSKPRYNAKDLSLYIASKYDIQVILGSATPSISSFIKVPYFRIKQKYFNSKNNTIVFDNSVLQLNDTILNKISNTIANDKQVIIFLPTRANFKYQVCSDCGKAVECPYCSVSMSLYRDARALKCHYCNYTQKIPDTCPSCTTGFIKNSRLGTAEVVEQLQQLFPQNTIGQFDRDKVRTDKQLRDILDKFNKNKIDILVGTQMLSKGHDYHNVSLAVILGIDSVLNMESYKARENALSLAIQIAGRSGRKTDGEVLIQTQNQEFFEYYLQESDFEEFLNEELKFRGSLYPPKIRLAKVIFSHKNGTMAQQEMFKYHNIANKSQEIQVVGFGESKIYKIADKYRFEILLRSSNIKALLQFLHSVECDFASIDMDTLS